MTFNRGYEKGSKFIIKNNESYKNFIQPYTEYINFYDFHKNEKIFYGSKNKNNLEILPKSEKTIINQTYNVVALDFVVYAFSEFVKNYQTLLNNGQISTNSKINRIIGSPAKSQVGFNMDNIFEENKKQFFEILIDVHSLALKTINIKDFVECYSENISLLKNKFQTHIQYFRSNQPKNINGLTINLLNENFNDDQGKVNFMLDENFLIYRKLAEQYGFYINQDAPWQLIANLSNPNLHNIIKQVNLETYLVEQGIPADVVVEMSNLNLLTLKADSLLEKAQFFNQLKNIGFKEEYLFKLKTSVSEINKKQITPDDIIKDYYDILLFIDYEKQKEFFYDAYVYLYDLRPSLTHSYYCSSKRETKVIDMKRELPPEKDYFIKSNELLFLFSYLKILNSERRYKYNNFEINNIKKEIKKKFVSGSAIDKNGALLYIYGKFETLVP